MTVNSISPSQPAQTTQAYKKTEDASTRKQPEAQEASKVKPRKDTAQHTAQVQKPHETSKPSVNTSGQKVGTLINVSA
jgi:hypothetical protein